MEHRINVTSFRYIGEAPYRFKASDFKIYTINKGDIITLENNHFARFLRQKADFVEVQKQEKRKNQETKVKAKEPEVKTKEVKEPESKEPEPKEVKEAEAKAKEVAPVTHTKEQEAQEVAPVTHTKEQETQEPQGA